MNLKKIIIASLILSCSVSTAFAKGLSTQEYTKVQKLIESNNFDIADSSLKTAMNKDPKDVSTKALWIVSLAKQYKLEPAQSELDKLMKANQDNADLHYAQGVVYMKRTTSSNAEYLNKTEKLYKDALSEFQKAFTIDKKHYGAYNAAGVVALNLNNAADAKMYFKKALEIEPNFAPAIDNVGTVDLMQNNLSSAEKNFNKALELNSKNTTAMYHLALVYAQKQNYSKAITTLNNALALNPNSSTIINLMGEIYNKQGNEAAAINAFKKSVSIKPENTTPYLNLANIYEKRVDGEFALEPLKTALAVNPNLYDARLKVADISLANAKYNQAIQHYSSLVDVSNYSSDALKGIANAYFGISKTSANNGILASSKDLYKAYDYITKATAANPDDLELHLAQLKMAKLTNQGDKSKEILDKIIQSPTIGVADTVVKGEAYLALNNYAEAEKTFKLEQNAAQTPEEDMYLAEILTYNKQYCCAKEVIAKILTTDADNKQALNNINYINKCETQAKNFHKSAKFFYREGNRTSAFEYVQRSLALNPNNPQGNLLYAKLCEKQKNYQEAINGYNAYLGYNKSKRVERKVVKLEKKLRSKKFTV